jgi:hypothetical protein
MNAIQFLASSVRHLGIRTGWKYFQLWRACRRDPALTQSIARRLRAKAAVMSERPVRGFIIDFADKLDECNRVYRGKT